MPGALGDADWLVPSELEAMEPGAGCPIRGALTPPLLGIGSNGRLLRIADFGCSAGGLGMGGKLLGGGAWRMALLC